MKWSNDSSSKVCLQLALNGNKRDIEEAAKKGIDMVEGVEKQEHRTYYYGLLVRKRELEAKLNSVT